ncbi:MAG: hypothetical protein EB053_04775 [Chlamydiae bacterium]|nr:hypothetical protein [Chlamydiota bacterium]
MEKTRSTKFAIIGLPGSGKSTFASKLGKFLDIPVHHLDRHMFEPNGKKRDKREFIEIQKAMLNEEAWVVEGCSFSTFELRFQKADVLIYFHFPRLTCYFRMLKRLFNYKKDFGGLRVMTWELLKYTWNFDRDKRYKIEELKNKYPKTKFLIFQGQRDVEAFFKNLS